MKYLLIVMVATHSCNLSNINGSEVSVATMEDKAECERLAELIDSRENTRAVCVPLEEK